MCRVISPGVQVGFRGIEKLACKLLAKASNVPSAC